MSRANQIIQMASAYAYYTLTTIFSHRARCKSKTGRHNQDRSRRTTNHSHRLILTRPVYKIIVATGLGFPLLI